MAESPQVFAINFTKLINAAKDKAEIVIKKTAFNILESLDYRSPVGDPTLWQYSAPAGYTGGQFRANWNISINSIDTSITASTDNQGNLKRGNDSIANYKIGDKVYITNAMPYAYRLEYGWSSQAPAGMVRITSIELEQYVRNQAAKL